MAGTSQKARMVYIEPNDLSTGSKRLDNVVWNPEDLSMFVDLQVIIPDRNYDGSISYDSTVYSMSVSQNHNQGKSVSFMGGEVLKGKHYITDDYVNVSYSEIHSTRVSNRETLGITSLDIDFNEYFYPTVNATFTDVRGGSLMNPAELEYTEGLKGGTAYTNLFRALFKYPYPRFLLTVKGFYGTKVTFQLAVNEFKTSLNGQTGNFDISVSFIGYMYGLYTDLPMNLILIAPYIDASNEEPSALWKDNANYVDSDGNKLLTFVEFMNSFVHVAESIAEDSSAAKEGSGIAEYTKAKQQAEKYQKLLDLFQSLYTGIKNKCDSLVIESPKHYVYFVDKKKEALNVDAQLYNNCFALVAEIKQEYDDDYNYGLKVVNVKGQNIELNGFTNPLVVNNVINTKSNSYSLVSGDTTVINEVKNSPELYNDRKVKVYEHQDLFNKLKEKIESLTPVINEKSIAATDEMQEIVAKKFGFKPTIRNFMRMLFAHIDCFMRYMYEKVLNEIKTQQTNGDRVKVSGFSADKYSIDVAYKVGDVSVPPFPGVYELNENYKEMIYPSMFTTMPEVDFVDKISKAAVSFRNAVNKIVKYAEQQGLLQDDENPDGAYKMTFLPTCISDFFFNGVNPYMFLKYRGDSSEAIGELLYKFLCRYRASSHTYRGAETVSNTVDLNNVAVTETNTESPTDKLPISKVEAFNYHKVKPNISQQFRDDFLSKGGDISVIKKYLNDFISNHNKDIISDVSESKGSYGHTDDVPIHFKTSLKSGSKYNETQIYRKKVNNIKECEDVFQILDKGNRGKIKSFLKLETVIGDNTETVTDYRYANSFIDLDVPCKTYYNNNTDNYNRIYKVVSSTQTNVIYNEYDKDKNGDGGEYFEMIASLLKNGDYTNYRMPFLNLRPTGKLTIFDSTSITRQADEAQALVFVSLFPFSEDSAVKSAMANLSKRSGINCIPKHILLYISGLLYMYDYEKQGKKLFHDVDGAKFPDYHIVDGYTLRSSESTFSHDDYTFVLDKTGSLYPDAMMFYEHLPHYKREILKKYFTDWVKGEFQTLRSALTNQKNLGKGKLMSANAQPILRRIFGTIKDSVDNAGEIRYIKDIGTQILLMKFYLDYAYVLNIIDFKDPDMVEAELSTFVNELAKLYGVDSSATAQNDDRTEFSEADVSKEMKLGCYMTLKNLYDRWLASYRYSNFKLPNPSDEILHKQSKLSGAFNEMGEWGVCEYNNFLFVDNYYNDIGDKYMLNPRIVYDMVKMSADSDTNYSVYQFMSDLLQKNKMMLMALPLFSNYYDITTIENIFKPYSLYGGHNMMTNGLGTTYLCMYTYEDSHVADFGGGDACFDNDGVDLADTLGNFMPVNGEDIRLFDTNDGELEITVPAFGVTFSKQNQSIFKSISINSDDSRATDYGIKNTMALASNARQGFVREPFGVGQDIFAIYSNKSYSCEITMMGCMNIMPMMYFQLNNIPMFKGAYMITHVSHSIKPGDVETKFKGIRVCRNQLPFNTDIFNLNAFIALVNEYTAKGRTYTQATLDESSSTTDNGASNDFTAVNYCGSEWAVAVQKMGAWYQANVHTYQSVCCSNLKTGRSKKSYACDLVNGDPVFDDCSGFVTACLKYFGVSTNKNYSYTSNDFTSTDKSQKCYKALTDAGFTRMEYSYAQLKPFDIIAKNGHVEIYYGKGQDGIHRSYSWGNTHDGLAHTCNVKKGKNHDVMPSKCTRTDIETNSVYRCIWRHS